MATKKNPVTMFGHEVSGDMAAVLGVISMRRRNMQELSLELGFNEAKVANLLRDIRKTYGRDAVSKGNGFLFETQRLRHKEK